MEKAAKGKSTPIKFNYHPFEFEKGKHAVTKTDPTGNERRYLCGITSGSKMDGHGERMTEECIKDFLDQANSGNILLYPDVHGIKSTDDIGILEKAEILPDGDWYNEFRLYDSMDNVGQVKLEKADTMWKQQKGLPPYKRPMQKGFSIEGMIPPGEILEAQKDESTGTIHNRVINKINLDGVIVCPRPAYKDSIAHSVFKALGEMTPYKEKKVRKDIRGNLNARVREEELRDKWYSKKWDVQDALESEIKGIMKNTDIVDKQATLEILFDEYKDIMVDLVLQSKDLFVDEENEGVEKSITPYAVKGMSNLDIFKALHHNLNCYIAILKSKNKKGEK